MTYKLTPVHAAANPHGGIGVYVHFPWCLKKCPYCDFLSIATAPEQIPHERYATAVISELEARVPAEPGVSVRSIFFGGGTPSLWQPEQLGRVLARIVERFGAESESLEVTVECNPSSLDESKARALHRVGVNRLSLGVQSLDADRLEFLGRWHSADEGLAAVRAAIASGIPRVSSDLIYGVHKQQPEVAAAEVRKLAELGLSHLSAYALTVEPQTAFGARARKGQLPLARESAVADSFLQVSEQLQRMGYEHYEISNFAQPGQRSEHNLGYWQGRDYLGLGCGAYGTLATNRGRPNVLPSAAASQGSPRYRYRNQPQPNRYMTTALGLNEPSSNLGDLTSTHETISPDTALTEAILLGLRLADGIDPTALSERTGAEFWTDERRRCVDLLLSQGRLVERKASLVIPMQHWLTADAVIRDLM